MLCIDIITLFPEVFAPFVGLSILGRAVEAGKIDIRYHHLLDQLRGSERADDVPFGGGAGMVLRIEPVASGSGRHHRRRPRYGAARDRRPVPRRRTLRTRDGAAVGFFR